MAITKKEIRKEISEIKALDKASDILIGDDDVRNSIYLKMADKVTFLIRRIINGRKISDYGAEDLEKSVKEINSHIKIDGEYEDEVSIYFDEEFTLHAQINIAITKINVFVLDKH